MDLNFKLYDLHCIGQFCMLSIEFETTHVSKYERKSIWKFYCFAVITLQLWALNGTTSAREASIFKDPKYCKTL